MSVGRVIVATWRPHEHAVLEAIHELGLELQVIFNKRAVMVLPAGVNKASAAAALEEMGLSPHNAVAVGDAENDHAFSLCEFSVAVANALPPVKETADSTTRADHGAGGGTDRGVATDPAGRESRLTRHHILLGSRDDGSEVRVPPYGINLLLVGTWQRQIDACHRLHGTPDREQVQLLRSRPRGDETFPASSLWERRTPRPWALKRSFNS